MPDSESEPVVPAVEQPTVPAGTTTERFVIDPTKNVSELVSLVNRRQDDLREAQDRYVAAQIQHVKDTAELRADHVRQLQEAESKRIDAIRTVDVNAVRVAEERVQQAVQALATITATNAETLRTAVAVSASTIAEQTRDAATANAQQTAARDAEMNKRIAALEQASYKGEGSKQIADPMMAEFMADVKSMLRSQTQTQGKSEGISSTMAMILMGLTFLSLVIGIGSFLFKPPAPVTAESPPIRAAK